MKKTPLTYAISALSLCVAFGVQAQGKALSAQETSANSQMKSLDYKVVIHNNATGNDFPGTVHLSGKRKYEVFALILSGGESTEKTSEFARKLGDQGVASLRFSPDVFQQSPEKIKLDLIAALTHIRKQTYAQPIQVGIVTLGSGGKLATFDSHDSYRLAFVAIVGGVPPSLAFQTGNQSLRSSILSLSNLSTPILALSGGSNPTEIVLKREPRSTSLEDSEGVRDPAKLVAEWIKRRSPKYYHRDQVAESYANNQSADFANPFPQAGKNIFDFPFHASLFRNPPIGGQPRPFGDWLW